VSLRRNVLIFHLGAIGDFILTWPLAMALGRLHPQSRILYITHGQKGELAERVLRVEWADIEEGWHHLFGPEPRVPEAVVRRLSAAHSICSFIARPDDIWTRNARALSHAETQLLTLEPRPPAGYARHATDFLIEQLESTPALKSATEQMRRAARQRGACSRGPDEGHIVIHPGSGGERKNWPRHHFVELIERLRRAGKRVRVVLGDVEAEKWSPADVSAFEAAADQVVRPTRLTELMDVVGRASVVVANDSGPAHLAGICSVPTVVLFGPTDPAVWAPLGPAVTTLRGEPIETIAVTRVYDTVVHLPGV
jgi:ADP-heptose:LPS heptosyltransferase